MGRIAILPEFVAGGPVTVGDARSHGVGRWRLETRAWRRIGPATYLPSDRAETREVKIEAASRRLPPTAAFSGFTAAWLHGLDVEPCDPIELTIPAPTTVSTRAGMVVRRRRLEKADLGEVRGYPVISAIRTVRDLCGRLGLTEAVVIADMALHRRLIALDDLDGPRLAKIAAHAEPASESPMETRLRMLLVLSGLPRPEAQVSIRDRWHRFAGRPDLYYREHRLGLEYDGGVHRNALVEDNRRQNRLLQAGVHLLRFTAADLLGAPDQVVAAVRAAMSGSVHKNGE
jgi:hypothetical protein